MSKKLANDLLMAGKHELTAPGSWRAATIKMGSDIYGNREKEGLAALFGSILQAEARRVLAQKKVKK